jgi:hypothetical protein
MCIDHHALNKITIKNNYLLLHIDNVLNRFNGCRNPSFGLATKARGARLRESRGKKPGSQKERSPGAKAKALEGCEPRGSPGVITYSRESKEVRGSVRE